MPVRAAGGKPRAEASLTNWRLRVRGGRPWSNKLGVQTSGWTAAGLEGSAGNGACGRTREGPA